MASPLYFFPARTLTFIDGSNPNFVAYFPSFLNNSIKWMVNSRSLAPWPSAPFPVFGTPPLCLRIAYSKRTAGIHHRIGKIQQFIFTFGAKYPFQVFFRLRYASYRASSITPVIEHIFHHVVLCNCIRTNNTVLIIACPKGIA